ncbi:MAG: lysylphosphatidylglycerol synthase transmembrane domain-containing protein [Candidatus Moraniibacteriota bacterium]
MPTEPTEEKPEFGLPKIPIWSLLISFVIIIGVSALAFARFGDFGRFLETAKRAEPWWLLAAVGFQALTYVSSGEVWNVAVRGAGYPLRSRILARLAIERLTVDQFMPTAGVAGHVGTLQAMRRFGVPTPIAMEALFVDLLSHYAAYVTAAAVAFSVLATHQDVTPIVLLSLGAFAAISAVVVVSTVLFLRNHNWIHRLPSWLANRKLVGRLTRSVAQVNAKRILSWGVFLEATLFQSAIFFLDGATLWATLRAVGVHASILVTFSAYIIAMIAGTVLFIPGGIGVFEVGAVTTLVGFGIPFEGAFAATLLLRGLTLWIPLIPGSILAHQDLGVRFSGSGKKSEESIESGS